MTGEKRVRGGSRRSGASKQPARASAEAEPADKEPKIAKWVVGPYGDLISREEYESLMGSQAADN